MQVFNPRSGLCDDQKNVEGCEETYPDEPRELDIEVVEFFTSVTIYLGQISLYCVCISVEHTFLVLSHILIDMQDWLTGKIIFKEF
jgi:hypothetical protein